MRYKNIIIKCKDNKEFVDLQKHLFRLSYNWLDVAGSRNRQIQDWYTEDCSILIKTDDRIRRPIIPDEFNLYKVVDFIRIIRKEKLKKINEGR